MFVVNEVLLYEYSVMMVESIFDVVKVINGCMLVFFILYDMLKVMYGYLKELNDFEEFVLFG